MPGLSIIDLAIATIVSFAGWYGGSYAAKGYKFVQEWRLERERIAKATFDPPPYKAKPIPGKCKPCAAIRRKLGMKPQ